VGTQFTGIAQFSEVYWMQSQKCNTRVIPMSARSVKRVIRQARDDSRCEFREVMLSPCGSMFTVWESVGFASDSDAKTQYQLQIGSKSEMQLFLKSEVERLCDEEGFAIVKVIPEISNRG